MYFSLNKTRNTVKPVYNDYLRDPKMVVDVDRWSLFKGHLLIKFKMVDVVARWSLFGDGRYLRFDCTS